MDKRTERRLVGWVGIVWTCGTVGAGLLWIGTNPDWERSEVAFQLLVLFGFLVGMVLAIRKVFNYEDDE